MTFEQRVRQLASGASLKIFEADNRRATLKFTMKSGRTQPLWIIPFDDVWEFSVPSVIAFRSLADFPHALLAMLMTINAKRKRAFWAIESVAGMHVVSAMLNFPSDNLTPVEFARICRALVFEVENLEQAFLAK